MELPETHDELFQFDEDFDLHYEVDTRIGLVPKRPYDTTKRLKSQHLLRLT